MSNIAVSYVDRLQLEGQLVTIRRFDESNITPAYIGWLSDPDLMRYSNQRFRSHDVDSCRRYLDSFKNTDNLFLSIYCRTEFVGTMTAYVFNAHQTADMGILVGARNQGRGLGSDAWSTLLRHLLKMGARKVTGGALRCNAAMIRIMIKAGMQPDGVRVAHELVDGRPEDVLHYAKFKD